ncbi:MAG TPA: hypothetical protein VMI94_25670 [Bryobacteraceae bacterium]|nr:hypothetical protein [Bryobacteraceae bacterium]
MSVKVFLIGVLAIASVLPVYGKSYEIVLDTPVYAGKVQLMPGAYYVKARNGEAVFTKVSSGATYSVPAKVETLGMKNPTTNVYLSHKNGQARIDWIQLGGKATDLRFGG